MELVIFVGLQGAGKSTLYAQRFAATHVRVSKDLMSHKSHKQQQQMAAIADALAAGTNVVVDNTNATVADRAPLIQLAREYGATVTGFFLATPLAMCLARNAQRSGTARVPNVAIYATRKRLAIPSATEGFDALWHVRTGSDGALLVEQQHEGVPG